MTRARLVSCAAIVLTVLGTGCALRPASPIVTQCPAPLTAYHRHVLYFGLSSELVEGGVITPAIWRAFSEEVLTRHFPAGMTVLDSYGEWRRGDGTHYGEPTKVVIHLGAVEDDSATTSAVQSVITEAKRRFGYSSVLWERSTACVAF